MTDEQLLEKKEALTARGKYLYDEMQRVRNRATFAAEQGHMHLVDEYLDQIDVLDISLQNNIDQLNIVRKEIKSGVKPKQFLDFEWKWKRKYK